MCSFVKRVSLFSYVLWCMIALFTVFWGCEAFHLSSRVVRTKYGAVRGLVVKPNNRALGEVEVFRGIPYAAPPVGQLRFMPPMSPLPWEGIQRADLLPPVCPQKLPDVTNRREALRRMPEGRFNYLQRLLPMLRNQSENCLYLNIYAPVTGNLSRVPVMVYIHGESYEWNSGNPYDGTVLAAYGQVIVVTVNFRLGILGFLRPALSAQYVTNFGLLDQIAALHWIKENIGAFGGDSQSITIFGHGTGAALANLLLISPVSQASKGLFHRAILMSGSALSRWAFTWDPHKYTIQVAKGMGCPLNGQGDELVNCLRKKTVSELLSIRLQTPPFTTPLGPILDGTVIKKDRYGMMKLDTTYLAKYDLIYGVSKAESFNVLTEAEVKSGMTQERKNRLLRAYVSNNFQHQARYIYTTITNEYHPWQEQGKPVNKKQIRDQILDILSDAEIVAPVISIGDLHSNSNSRSYFYVFNHQSIYGDYPISQGAVHGEELAYVFGAPLVGGFSHFGLNYTREEMYLAELMMILWTNFAKTGNPNLPAPQGFLTEEANFEWHENLRTMWAAFEPIKQHYLHIDMQVVRKSHYRAKKMAIWNRVIPEMITSMEPVVPDSYPLPLAPPTVTLIPTVKPPLFVPYATSSTFKPTYYSPPTYHPLDPVYKPRPSRHQSMEDIDRATQAPSPLPPNYGGTPVSIIILIGILILFFNCFAMAGIYYKRDQLRIRSKTNRKKNDESKQSAASDDMMSLETITPHNSTSSANKTKEGERASRRKTRQKTSEGHTEVETLNENSSRVSTLSRDSHPRDRENSSRVSTLSRDSHPRDRDKEEKQLSSQHSRSVSQSPKDDDKKTLVQESKSKTVKSVKAELKRKKSDSSIYSEIGRTTEVTVHKEDNVIYQKTPSVTFGNSVSLPPKSRTKSTSSISSIRSVTSRTSIKSTSSRTSVKSTSSVKPITKNASCQSLPTAEYGWGITKEMTMDRHEPEGRDSHVIIDHSLGSSHKKSYTQVLVGGSTSAEFHASTLPRVKPPPPLRTTSLTQKDIHELERMDLIYRSKPASMKNASADSTNIDPFYGMGGGEAPASPTGIMYGPSDLPTATVRPRSRKIDVPEYGHGHPSVIKQYPPYESFSQCRDGHHSGAIPKIPQVPEVTKVYGSYGDSRAPRGPLASFSKSDSLRKTKVTKSGDQGEPGSPVTNNAPIITAAAHTAFAAAAAPAFVGASYPNKTDDRRTTDARQQPAIVTSDSSSSSLYEQSDTGTIKRRKTVATRLPDHQQPEPQTPDKTLEKPLKSALKQTSAYDRPKPNQSFSSGSGVSVTIKSSSDTPCESDDSAARTNTLKRDTQFSSGP